MCYRGTPALNDSLSLELSVDIDVSDSRLRTTVVIRIQFVLDLIQQRGELEVGPIARLEGRRPSTARTARTAPA